MSNNLTPDHGPGDGPEYRPDGRPNREPSQGMVYQIRISGHLGRQWTEWFDGLSIVLEANGDTVLTGPVTDQAALYGLLKKVRDLGMRLISVIPLE